MENRVLEPRNVWLWENQDSRNHQLLFNELYKKTVFSCGCPGWSLIVEENPDECFLWNAFTLESIQLPSLGSEAIVKSCVLSSSPDDPKSLILVFFNHGSSFMFCRVGDQHWTEQSVTHDDDAGDGDGDDGDDDAGDGDGDGDGDDDGDGGDDDDVDDDGGDDDDGDGYDGNIHLWNPVCCDGRIYVCCDGRTYGLGDVIIGNGTQLLEIDLNMQDGHLVIHRRGSIPSWKDPSMCCCRYMVESCGDIFIIFILLGAKLMKEIIGVEISKLDFSLMEWTQVKSAKDRVFFLDLCSGYSYRSETEGNRINFTLYDRRIYTFHIEDNTVAASLPYPDLISPWRFWIWIMAPISNRHVMKVKENPEHMKHILPCLQGDDDEEAKDLPLDILSSIGRCLALHDYNIFRLLNRTVRLESPPMLARDFAWLMSCKRGEDKCKFSSPLQEPSYLMNNPNRLDDVRMCYSKKGWCLMIQSKDHHLYIFLWNPFANKIIPVTTPLDYVDDIVGCEFLSSPDSSDCVIVLIRDLGEVDYINVNQGSWGTRFVIDRGFRRLSSHNNPLFSNGNLCLVDSNGTLTMFKPDDSFLEVERPCKSFYQSFLLEANEKLLVVFLGFMGKWLRVFEMDLSKLVWIEVDNVGDKTLHVSRISSFATTATREEMKNTVCLPRLCGNKLIYYSLSSGKYHCYGSNIVFEDFYDTKELLYSGWIEPSS